MNSPMDKANYNVVNTPVQSNMVSMYRAAMQNPKAFEEQFRRSNPQAYEQAVALARSRNPKDIVMQILNQRGINPMMFMSNN